MAKMTKEQVRRHWEFAQTMRAGDFWERVAWFCSDSNDYATKSKLKGTVGHTIYYDKVLGIYYDDQNWLEKNGHDYGDPYHFVKILADDEAQAILDNKYVWKVG